MKSLMIPATILVVVAIVAIAQTTTSPQDEQAIQKVVATFVDARNAFDARNMAGLFTEDAQFTSNLGRSVEGRAAIEKLIADSLQNQLNTRSSRTVKSIRFVTPQVAVVTTTGEVTSISGHFMDVNVMTKRGGAWMIASYYNVRLP